MGETVPLRRGGPRGLGRGLGLAQGGIVVAVRGEAISCFFDEIASSLCSSQ
jgi:hypothetical protein